MNDRDIVESFGVETAYCTTDFEFVAFALAYRKPKVRILGLVPYESPSARDRRKNVKYEFVLGGPEDDPTWRDNLISLSVDYVNGDTLIEPKALATSRRFLRSLIIDNDHMKREVKGGFHNHPRFTSAVPRQKR